MVDYLSKSTVYVNSADRSSGTSSDFTISLIEQITMPNEYDYATLLEASIPKSYYNINSGNKYIHVIENGVTTTVSLPIGNYNFSDLAPIIASTINASASWVYAVSKSLSTGKYTFTVLGNGGLQPSFLFDTDTPYRILGFDKDTYAFTANTLTSPNVVNFQLCNALYLMSNIITKEGIFEAIVPNTESFSSIVYQNTTPVFSSKRINKDQLSAARFWVLDSEFNPIDLNGVNYEFSFAVYKRNTYYNIAVDDYRIHLLETGE